MKKILYITYDWWFDTDIEILTSLSQNYIINVYVISLKETNINKYPIKKSPNKNITIKDFQIWNKKDKISLFYNSIKFAIKAIKASKSCDYVLYIDDSNPITVSILSLLLPSYKTIVTFHDFIMHSDEPFFKRLSHKIILKKFFYFHFFSHTQYSSFKENATSRQKGFYTLMPLKDFGNQSIPLKFPFSNKSKKFLFFGYIRDYKRLDLFIKAAKRVKGCAEFIIAGYCPDWSRYEHLINDDKRFFCNITFIPNSQIASYFKIADFLVLPYSDSTQSGPLLIALNYSLPIIASSQKIFEYYISNKINGFIFQDGNEEELYEIMQLATNMDDFKYTAMKEAQARFRIKYQKEADFIEAFKDFIILNKI